MSFTKGVKYTQEMRDMLHNEARKFLLKAWDRTHNAKEVAEYFSVNESTVYRLVERRDRTGSFETRTQLRGRKPALSQEQTESIIRLVKEHSDITLNEIIEQLDLKVSIETVRRTLLKAGYTYKKKSMHAKEQERLRCPEQEETLARRYRWIQG